VGWKACWKMAMASLEVIVEVVGTSTHMKRWRKNSNAETVGTK